MAAQQRTLPFADGMALGLGINDLTGEVGTLDAVSYAGVDAAENDEGMEARYDTSLVYSSEQMYEALGVSVAAAGRYGLFSAEGKFKFAEESRFNSTSTFLVARADVQNAFQRLINPQPVADANQLVGDGKRDLFRKRYGDLFIRGIKSGGEYIAVLSITAQQQQLQRDLAVALKASFDGIAASGSVDAEMQQTVTQLRQRSEIRVSVYQRGGAGDQISYTGTIEEVMARLKVFAATVKERPKAYSVQAASYETLVFQAEPNWFDIRKQQEVLEDCMKQRIQLLQIRNDLEMLLLHPNYFREPPGTAVISAWNTHVNQTLNELDRHVSAVVDSVEAAKFFTLTLPDGFQPPERIEHSSEQVEIYTHADYAPEWQGIPGTSQKLAIGRYDDSRSQILVGNDQISSLKVPNGLAVRAYEHAWFQGAFIDFTADTPKVPMDWNDRISSLVVYKASEMPPRTDYAVGLDFTWSRPARLFKVGKYPDLGATSLGVARLSTLLVPQGLVVRLWDQPDFQGASADFYSDALELPAEWNNRAASMEVIQYDEQ